MIASWTEGYMGLGFPGQALGARSQGRGGGAQIGSEQRSSGKYLFALQLAAEPLSKNGLEGADGGRDTEMPALT